MSESSNKKYFHLSRSVPKPRINKIGGHNFLEFKNTKKLLRGFSAFQENKKRKNKFDNSLGLIYQLTNEVENYEKIRRKILQEKKMKTRFENNYAKIKVNFESIEIKNLDDINNFKESQIKFIEEGKEKRIKECNEKYKNIMDKLDLIKNRDEFYDFLKTFDLK